MNILKYWAWAQHLGQGIGQAYLTNVHAHLVITIMIVLKECKNRRIASCPELSK
jgi:hypothetical protein